MKKLKLPFTLLLIVLIFTSCASSFKPINPENQEFSHRSETNNLSIEYNPNILKYSKNTKFQKKVDRKKISFIIGKFTNKGSDSINLSKDVTFNVQNKSIEETYSKLKQRPWTYYLALISAGFSVNSEGSSGSIGINPLALAYSIPNSIVAAIANKKMKKELNKYNFENKVVAPNESKYVSMAYDNINNSILEIKTVKGSKVDSKTNSAEYGSFLIDNCIDYDKQRYSSYNNYHKNLMQCLEASKLARNVIPFERKYKNGKTKILGVNAKHKLGKNPNYLYKIGTWAFYKEDGTIEKFIEYDTNGKEIQK